MQVLDPTAARQSFCYVRSWQGTDRLKCREICSEREAEVSLTNWFSDCSDRTIRAEFPQRDRQFCAAFSAANGTQKKYHIPFFAQQHIMRHVHRMALSR